MNVDKAYIAQVRAALWNNAVQWSVDQTEGLMARHMQQGTGPLVFPSVLAQEGIPAVVRAQMKAVCLHTMQQQVKINHTLHVAWTALVKAGLHPVLMKGAGLSVFYPEPQCRPYGDIDLFLGVEQYHPACAVMRETFPDALKFDEELDHYKHYNLIADGVSIEVHRVSVSFPHPLDVSRYARMEKEGMQGERLQLDGLEVMVPEPTFNALFVMLHSWEHTMTCGANLRQICDLTLLLHHYAGQIDKPRLQRYLKALCLTDVWQLYMSVAVEQLGLPEDEAPFYSAAVRPRAERLLADLLAGRLVAPSGTQPAPKGRIARKWHTMKERLANAERMAPYSPVYVRHMKIATLIHGAARFFAKDRHWE